MINQEKNKWLIENILGECWHEWWWDGDFWKCSKCKGHWEEDKENTPNFFTTDSDQQAINFFRLWEAIRERSWFIEFMSDLNNYLGGTSCNCEELQHIPWKYLSCSTLANAIGEYFKWDEIK